MTIKWMPSALPSEPLATYEWEGTYADWLKSRDIVFERRPDVPPPFVTVNGQPLPESEWGTRILRAEDDVRLVILPQGGILSGIANIIGGLFNAVFGWLIPSAGGGYGSPEAGQQLEPSQAKANQARLGEVVPELAGHFKRFPDYLTPPRRYFTNRREQWLEFMACVGPGRYQIEPDAIKIGETPISMLGDGAEAIVFEPGDDVTVTTAHEHWHTAPEVGGTSSGTAGLELSTELGNRANDDPASYDFDGTTIERTDGHYPVAWGNGTQVRVAYPRSYDVQTVLVTNPSDPEDYYFISEITGYFGHIPLVLNGPVALGAYSAFMPVYRITSIDPGAGGMATIRLWDDAEPGGPVLLTPGVQSLQFGSDIVRTIEMVSEDSLTLAGPLVFEAATVTGASVEFSGGYVFGEPSPEIVATPANEVSGAFELDFFFPQGLGVVQNNGDVTSRTVRLEVRRRNLDTDALVTTFHTYTDSTLDQIGITERIELSTPGRYSFRVRRASAQAVLTTERDEVHWQGLKCRLPTAANYPRWTTIGLRFRSGGHLGAQAENKISVEATRILREMLPDGSWSAEVPTRSIVAFARYVAESIGQTPADFDTDEWEALNALWTSRGDTMDHVFSETTVRDALRAVFGAGMGTFTVSDGLIRPVREGMRTVFEQAYSTQNMTRMMRRSFRARTPSDHDGVEVEYTDGETWTQQTVICALPGSARQRLLKHKLIGITDRTRAWRYGMRMAREQRYSTWEYDWSTEMDLFVSEFGSYVGLMSDVPGYQQSALIVGVEPLGAGRYEIHSTEPLERKPGVNYVFAYRDEQGTLKGPWAAEPGTDEYSLIAEMDSPPPEPTLKQELPHLYFGPIDRWVFPAIIQSIAATEGNQASAKAKNYDVRVYADDDNSPDE